MQPKGILIVDNRKINSKIEQALECSKKCKLYYTDSAKEAIELIKVNPDYWLAVFFTFYSQDIEKLCLEIRANPKTENLVIIGIDKHPWESNLDKMFLCSIDDFLIDDDLSEINSKLSVVNIACDWSELKKEIGKVILAEPDQKRRIFYGRLLRRRGFDLCFAIDENDIEKHLREDPHIELIVSPTKFENNNIKDFIKKIREKGGKDLPWIIMGKYEEITEYYGSGKELAPITIYNTLYSPENIIFLVNELLCPAPNNLRKSPRLLFSGPVMIKHTPTGRIIWGYLYNINETGLFIRTLTPLPKDSEMELFFRPPFGEGRVKLRGRCVWTKGYSDTKGPVVPPGMGVIFTNISIADKAALMSGYEALKTANPNDPDFISINII